MTRTIVRNLPLVVTLALACIGVSAVGQTAAPSTTPKMEKEGEKIWDKTKEDTEKALKATEKGAKAAGSEVDKAGTDAADGTRKVGDKIGEKIPGTTQNEAVKKKP